MASALGTISDRPGVTPFGLATVRIFFILLATALAGAMLQGSQPGIALAPAPVVLVALMLRWRLWNQPAIWAASFLAMALAEFLDRGHLAPALAWAAAGLASTAVALRVLLPRSQCIRGLRHPGAIFWLGYAAFAAALAAGLARAVLDSVLPDATVSGSLVQGFAGGLVSYIVFLPALLTIPEPEALKARFSRGLWLRRTDFLPVAALGLSLLVASKTGGVGGLAFPLLALICCALLYPVFLTALLTLLAGAAAAAGMLAGAGAAAPGAWTGSGTWTGMSLFALQMAAAALSLVPLTVGVMAQSRRELASRLRYLATRGALSGLEDRVSFRAEADQLLQDSRLPVAMLLVDLDHFRTLTGAIGEPAGSRILQESARRISACLRPDDLFGRLGGEEFAILLPGCPPRLAARIAERIRAALSDLPVQVPGQTNVVISASIGLLTARRGGDWSVDQLFSAVDCCLFNARSEGRNRVVSLAI